MLSSIWSALGWKEGQEEQEEPSPSPPSVTITGVRIPADGTPAHLLPLTTISDNGAGDGFLFHVPDLRHYWKTKKAWQYRDLQRLDLQQGHHVQLQHYLQQRHHLQELLRIQRQHSYQQIFRLRQRYLIEYQHHILKQHHSSLCVGTYYIFFSFAVDDLPRNSFIPTWIENNGFYGDVFLVKMAPHEYGEHGWAVYEDMVPEFLDFLIEGPLDG